MRRPLGMPILILIVIVIVIEEGVSALIFDMSPC